jgi:hypothetical protein
LQLFVENPELLAQVVACVLDLDQCINFATGTEKTWRDDSAHVV